MANIFRTLLGPGEFSELAPPLLVSSVIGRSRGELGESRTISVPCGCSHTHFGWSEVRWDELRWDQPRVIWTYLPVWRTGNQVALHRARLVLGWVTCHPGQLSLLFSAGPAEICSVAVWLGE